MPSRSKYRLVAIVVAAFVVLCLLPTHHLSKATPGPIPQDPAADDASSGLASDDANATLLQLVEDQIPSVVDQQQALSLAASSAAMQVWQEQDAVVQSWPKFEDAREDIEKNVAAEFNLDQLSVEELQAAAAQLRETFWRQEGSLAPQGYVPAYEARVLLETAHAREPQNLSVSDDLVETILTSHPMDQYNPDTKTRDPNPNVVNVLNNLRSEGYAQTRQEVEQGRAFTWADFARTSDFASLFSALDPPKASDAFEWALAQAGARIKDEYRDYFIGVLGLLRAGGGVNFGIYDVNGGSFPHDYIYCRRLPSFRGPDSAGMGLVARWSDE